MKGFRKQKTVKTVEEVLEWIETTPHHLASVIAKPGYFMLADYQEKLFIPDALYTKVRDLIEPSQNRFDNRMFRATKSGKARLRRWRRAQELSISLRETSACAAAT